MSMLVTVARFFDPWEAQIVSARLRAEDIPSVVAYANHAVADWPMSIALGGSAVQVPVEHLEAARNLVHAYREGELEDDLHAALGTKRARCGACGSTQHRQTVAWGERVLVTVMAVFGAVYPTRQRAVSCAGCGAEWQTGEN